MSSPQRESGTIRLTARVHGEVQGVGYRYFARRNALALGLRGYARNLADSTVEVVAEGTRATLEELLRRLERGPSAAEVRQVETAWGAADGTLAGFQVRG
ncbi:MAG TPA: acylphosphatase [Ktedonobacterales bacterium]|jgi:acylphosphatase|nr:acylphosphatase [Ktedonobacterales bacterium]